MSTILTVAQPRLHIRDRQILANSLDVAKSFRKQHKNILQAIERLEVPEEFIRLNFQPIFYLDQYGREQPAIDMTRDGFTILAMGFTGKRAMEFKLAYIDEFNRMEAELNHGSSQTLTIHQLIDKTISNILASKRERYRVFITERLLDEYGASRLEDVPVKSAKPGLEIFAVFQEAHLEQREGTGDQVHMDPDELERVMLQIAVEGIQKVKRHISQREDVPPAKKPLGRSLPPNLTPTKPDRMANR